MSIAEIAKTTPRDVFGNVLLQEAFESREKIAELIKEVVDKPTEKWGVDITRVLIQQIIIPQDLLRGLASAATAKREVEPKVIQAQADIDAAKLMREASDALNTPAANVIWMLSPHLDKRGTLKLFSCQKKARTSVLMLNRSKTSWFKANLFD